MKKLLLLTLIVASSCTGLYAQRAVTMTIKNFSLAGDHSTFSFDIYVRSTGGTLINDVGGSDFYFNVTSSAFNTGVDPILTNVNSKYTAGSPTGDYLAMTTAWIGGEPEVSINEDPAGTSQSGDVMSTTAPDGERIATVTLTVADTTKTAGLSWDNTNTAMLRWGAFTLINKSTTGSSNASLPVTLAHFDVTAQGPTDAKLTWQTATETNNRGFFVERSIDGNSWNVVNFVPTLTPGGNSKILTNYQYLDANVYKSWNGISTYYYRLRQQDFNGVEEYVGGIKAVRFGDAKEAAVVSVFPNPASTFINIAVKNGVASRYSINDMTGRPVANGSYAPRIDVGFLKSGNYQIRVMDVTGAILGTQQVIIAR